MGGKANPGVCIAHRVVRQSPRRSTLKYLQSSVELHYSPSARSDDVAPPRCGPFIEPASFVSRGGALLCPSQQQQQQPRGTANGANEEKFARLSISAADGDARCRRDRRCADRSDFPGILLFFFHFSLKPSG